MVKPAAENFVIDMDGVLVRGNTLIPGADKFISQLEEQERPFLVLTNNPIYTPKDLAHRLKIAGLNISENHIFTSAIATARFLHSQQPEGTAFVIGESGLTEAIHEVGYVITDTKPDYVVLGETISYNYEMLTKAVRLVAAGSKFIATNPDASGPTEHGIVPGCGASAALIEKASGKAPFFIGKPNPLMMRTALNFLGVHSKNTAMIGDRMDTDMIAGVEAGLETILVLSGVTERSEIERYPYRPTLIAQSVADIEL